MSDLAFWIGIGIASLIFSALFAIVLGQLFQNNDPPNNNTDKITDAGDVWLANMSRRAADAPVHNIRIAEGKERNLV